MSFSGTFTGMATAMAMSLASADTRIDEQLPVRPLLPEGEAALSSPSHPVLYFDDWEKLGPYFKTAFAQNIGHWHPEWSGPDRREYIQGRYEAFSEATGMDAPISCIPLFEVVAILESGFENSGIWGISSAQRAHTWLVWDMAHSETGTEILGSLMQEDVLICAEDDGPNLGAFYPRNKTASVSWWM
jgi:hypothetical protein